MSKGLEALERLGKFRNEDGMFGNYEFTNGGLHKIKKFKKSDMKITKKGFNQIYPKPFNKRNAFYKQKRGKR